VEVHHLHQVSKGKSNIFLSKIKVNDVVLNELFVNSGVPSNAEGQPVPRSRNKDGTTTAAGNHGIGTNV